KRDEAADRHPSLFDLSARVGEETDQANAGEHFHERGVQRLESDRPPRDPEITVVRLRETVRLEFLHAVRLDDAVAAQGLGEQSADSPDPLAGGEGGLPQPTGVVDDGQEDDRGDDENPEGESGVQREGVDEDQEDRQHALREVGEPGPERALDLLDVREHPGKEVSRGRLRVEARRFPEKLPVRVVAEVPDHRNDAYRQLLRKSARFYSQASTGDLLSRMLSDVEQIQSAFGTRLADFAQGVLTILLVLVYAFSLNPGLAFGVFVIAPIVLLPIVDNTRRLGKAAFSSRERIGGIGALLSETLRGHRVIKTYGMEEFEA